MPVVPSRFKHFTQFSSAGLALNFFTILWGAYVRASQSGAGCGSHWPLCNGGVILQNATLHTWIEYTHRLSSGLCLIFAITLFFLARSLFPVGHLARKAATTTFIFTFSEALIGAALVLFELVAHDRSAARAFSISLHLLNTLILLASLTLCIRWSKDSTKKLTLSRELLPWFFASYISFAGLAVTGALNALGDTLFKTASLAAGMAQDFAPGSHFLVKLRIAHPSLAVGTAALLLLFAEQCESLSQDTRRWARLTQAGVFLQLAVGVLNLTMLAPDYLQIVHLLIADLVWVSLVMLGVSALETRPVKIFAGLGEPSISSQALS